MINSEAQCTPEWFETEYQGSTSPLLSAVGIAAGHMQTGIVQEPLATLSSK